MLFPKPEHGPISFISRKSSSAHLAGSAQTPEHQGTLSRPGVKTRTRSRSRGNALWAVVLVLGGPAAAPTRVGSRSGALRPPRGRWADGRSLLCVSHLLCTDQ